MATDKRSEQHANKTHTHTRKPTHYYFKSWGRGPGLSLDLAWLGVAWLGGAWVMGWGVVGGLCVAVNGMACSAAVSGMCAWPVVPPPSQTELTH